MTWCKKCTQNLWISVPHVSPMSFKFYMQHSKLHFWSDIPINKPNVLFQKMNVFIDLNHYVKQNVTKTLHPLLVENGCREFKIPTSSWKLEKSSNEPDKEDWEELTKYKLEQTQKRQTIPVNGKLQIQDGNIYLKVYIKYWNLRTITKDDEIYIEKLWHTYRQPCPVVPSAQLGHNQVQYYAIRKLYQGQIDKQVTASYPEFWSSYPRLEDSRWRKRV